jgi:uncharacterized repeat protein (TIGR03803 family)
MSSAALMARSRSRRCSRRDGRPYGTTEDGGASGLGTVFRVDRRGRLKTLHSFNAATGQSPFAGVIQASDGLFYGTSSGGGLSRHGTVQGTGELVRGTSCFTLPEGWPRSA